MCIKELKNNLYKCYSKELCYYKVQNKWNESNKYLGMCAITTLIVNDYYGGKICKTHVDGISHYFNLIDDKIVDLTSEQFKNNIDYNNYQVISREGILTDDTKYRYRLLKEKLNNIKS